MKYPGQDAVQAKKNQSRGLVVEMVELSGIEPLTSTLPVLRSPS